MDPDTLNQLIAAGAGLVGAIVGAGGTLLTAGWQHRLTIKSERQKEARAREKRAAESCSSLLTKLAKLTRKQSESKVADNDSDERSNEMLRLDEELRIESMYLPADVRRRVEDARKVLERAESLREVSFYCSTASVTLHVASHANQVLAAFIRDERLPERSEVMEYLFIALDELEAQWRHESAEEVYESEEEKRRWIAEHPEARPPDQTQADG